MPGARYNPSKLNDLYGDVTISSVAQGDVLYRNASLWVNLAGNTTATKKFLSQTGDGSNSANPSWAALTSLDVGLGNVENTALSTWGGTTNITTVGAITTGLWSGTTIGISKGGTGQTTASAAFNALCPITIAASAATFANTGSATVTVGTPDSGAGNAITLKASPAASGNTNGGNTVLWMGAASGSGVDGKVLVKKPDGTTVASIANDGTVTIASGGYLQWDFGSYIIAYNNIAGVVVYASHPNATIYLGGLQGGPTGVADQILCGCVHGGYSTDFHVASGGTYGDSQTAGNLHLRGGANFAGGTNSNGGQVYLYGGAGSGSGTTGDVYLNYDGTSTVGLAYAKGGIQNTAGRSRITADITRTSTTFASISDLSLTLKAGRKYTGRVVIKCNNSVASEGIKLDFNGGTATMTSFWAAGNVITSGSNVPVATIATSLSGVINFSTITGETLITLEVSLVVNAAGTFIPRCAENSALSGTLTVELGSFLWLEDSPN